MADIIKHDKQQFVPQAGGQIHGVRSQEAPLWKQARRCHGRIREPIPQTATSQAGGLTDCSRWLSEAWRATPPEKYHKEKRIPEGCQMFRLSTSGTPSGCGYFYHEFRWCRSLTRPQPQPPAKIFQASGLRNRRTKTTAKPFPNRATRLPEPARATLGIESPSPANLEKVASD